MSLAHVLAGHRERHILVTGGTGFVGRSLIGWLDANAGEQSNLKITAVARSINIGVQREFEALRNVRVSTECIDVRALPEDFGRFDAIIHAATPASLDLSVSQPEEMRDIIEMGIKSVIRLARRVGGRIPVLFTSSGAVYGEQPIDIARLPENAARRDTLGAYSSAKRSAEHLLLEAGLDGVISPKIARLFAFIGPYLPLDRHFAAGNFIRDALRGAPITIAGDGSAVRSYLSSIDMARWIWSVLFLGKSGRAYNVGSERAVSILELAHTVAARSASGCEVVVLGGAPNPGAGRRYVPDTSRIRDELDEKETISLESAIDETLLYHRKAETTSR